MRRGDDVSEGGAIPNTNDDDADSERRLLLSSSEDIPAIDYHTSQPFLSHHEQMRVHPNYKSQPYISTMVTNNLLSSSHMLTKSYSVNADGSLSYLTPLQLGRHELYEMIPFTAVFGLQQKERNITKAYANYAADVDTIEVDTLVFSRTQQHLSMAEMNARKLHSSLLLMEELELDAVVITTPLMIALFVAGMAQFLVGYNTSVMNSPSSVVFQGHTTFQWSFAVAVFAVGGPFGAVFAGNTIDTRGRRGGMAIVIYLFLIGGLIQTLANNMIQIIASRFIIGFASGFSSVLVPVYLGELAPPTLRGTFGTLTQFSLVTGIFVSDMLAFPFANERSWRLLFAVTVVIAIVQILCLPFLIESPRWLLACDRKSRIARHIIKKLRGLRYEHEVEIEVDHFVRASHAQSCDNNDDHTTSGIALVAMLMDRQIRRLLICSLVLQMAQQLCGINAVFYYSTMFFDGVIENPLMGTCIVGGVNVAATYVALRLMENTNRRTLILWSAGGMFISAVALMLCLLGYFDKFASLFFVLAYVAFFEVGLGPIPWLVVAEMFEAKYVATAMSVSCQLNWACNFIVGIVFPYLQEYLGALSFFPFALVLLMTFAFAATILPETKGITPEELRDEIMRSLSTMLVLSTGTTVASSEGNPIDVEWRRAMSDLRRLEEEDMKRGSYNYGFQPIEQRQEDEEYDWKVRIGGDPST